MKVKRDIGFICICFFVNVMVCRLELTGCVGLECLNGGTVIARGGFCQCICISGFSGITCEYKLRESMWPRGPYYLPMPKGGCPETKAQGWKTGYLNFTTEVPFTAGTYYNNVSNTMTSLSNLSFEETGILGPYGLYNLQMNFCFKTGDHTLTTTNKWPNWEIEIFASNEGCPIEFETDTFVTLFPHLLHWNADGYIPPFHILHESDSNTTEISFTLCKRIVVDDPVILYWDRPFLFIKQPFTVCNGSGMQKDYLVYEDRYPIDVSGLFTNYSYHLPLEFCFYKPVIANNLFACVSCDLSEYDRSNVLFTTEKVKEVKQCLRGLLSYHFDYIHEVPTTRDCAVMTWIMIDARMSVMVAGIYMIDSSTLPFHSKTTVFIDRFKWGFLNNGAHVCNYDIGSSWRSLEMYLKCHRTLEGRYVTLLSQWKDMWTYRAFGKDLSPEKIYLAILPPGELDVYGQLQTPCYIELGMQQKAIQDFQLTASSYEAGYPPHNARPGSGGWCALVTDKNPYIQVDLLSVTIVDAVSITNWNEMLESSKKNKFIAEMMPYGSSSFQFWFATSLNNMIRYGNRSFYIDTSLKFTEQRTFLFHKPFAARYVRFYPVALGTLACLNFELFGCRKSGLPSVYCRNDSSAETFGGIPLPAHVTNPLTIYNNISASQCENKCFNDSHICSMFEHYSNDTCTLFLMDENQPFSGDVKFEETKTTSWTDNTFREAKPVVDLRRTLICWRDSVEFQFPRFRKKNTGLRSYNTTLRVVNNKRKMIFSPGYPFYYDAYQVFLWTINSGNYIRILFLDISLKTASNKNQCDYKEVSKDVIVISKKQPVFSLATVVEDISFYIGFERNGQTPVIRTDSTTLYLYFWTYGYNSEQTERGFRALVYSDETPECGLPDKDRIYRCNQYSVRFASQEILQIPDKAYEAHFIYTPKDDEGRFAYIKVVFELLEVSCSKDSQFILYGHLEIWNICNINRPREPMILYDKMEIKYRISTNINPRHPLEGFRSFVKLIKREDSHVRPPPFFFDELTLECHDPAFRYCFQVAAYVTKRELCVDQFSKCYLMYGLTHDVKSNMWTWAASYCEKKDRILLTLQSPEEMNYIRRALLEFSRRVWSSKQFLSYQDRSTHIGLFRFTNSEGTIEERWADGSPLTFTAWSRDDPTMDRKRGCTIMDFTNVSNDNPWHKTNCDDVVNYFICEKKIAKAPSAINVMDFTDVVKTDMVDIAHILYRCSNDEWIHVLSMCNGMTECSNSADELSCDETSVCGERYFQCSNGECIHVSRVCDFSQDCADNSDEFCDFPSCSVGKEFRCANDQCIHQYQVCDAIPHCLDGSDEQNCVICNSSVAFACGDKRCIPLHLTCDMYADCEFGEDEVSCGKWNYSTCDDVLLGGIRESGFFLIAGVWAECIFDVYNKTITMNFRNIDWEPAYNDGIIILPEDAVSEAFYSGYTCYQKIILDLPLYRKELEEFLYQYKNSSAIREYILPISSGYKKEISEGLDITISDGNRHVDFGRSYNDKLSLYTGPVSCYKDLHASVQSGLKIPVPEFISANVSVDNYWLYLTPCGLNLRPVFVERQCVFDTDGTRQIEGCRSLEHLKNCEKYQCSLEYFKCPRSFCIPYNLVCDGRVHCPEGEDEMNCTSDPDIKNFFIYFFGDDNELADAAHNLATQLFKDKLEIQIFNVKKIIIDTMDGLSSGYMFRTYNVTSVMSLIKRFQKEHNVSSDNIETDMNQILQKIDANETLSISLQNKKLTKEEENILNKIERALSSQFNCKIERNEKFHRKLQITLSQNKVSRYVTINNWKMLRTGGSLLFPDVYSADTPCRNGFRCSFSHVCIPLSKVCDKKPHCPHGDDEELCDFICPGNCSCEGYSASCPSQSYNVINFLPSSIRTLDVNHCTGMNGTLDIQLDFSFLIKLNISFSNIAIISMESFSHTKNLLMLDLSHNLLIVIQKNVFYELKYLEMLLLRGNREISVIEPFAFNGLGIKELTISYTKLKAIFKDSFYKLNLTKLDLSHSSIETVEDFAFRGLIVSELDINFNPIKNFGIAMFTDLIGVQKLKTPMYKFCCMRPIYLKEENCFPHKDEFSSCGDLMRRTSLQFLLWIIGILAISGNIASLAFRVFFDQKRLKMVYVIFVTNLAAADLLMGLYMLIIAIADRVYSNRYIEEDEHWRRSGWCSLAGVLSTVSSEASVLFVCLITVDRFLLIKYPFGTVRISLNLAKLTVLLCWIVCFIIAILPVVQSGYFGDQFYAKTAVCLALPLTKDRSTGWLYSITIFIGFNFVTFILIALGQIMIFSQVRHQSSMMKKKNSARRNDLKVARNLLLLVTTDFACWFPIGCMGMLSLTGHTIPGEVYAWTAVLVLPINSAINPFLYTLMAIISSKKFNPRPDEQIRSEYVTGKRTGFLHAYNGLWFPGPTDEFDVYNLKSDVVFRLKQDDLLWICVEFLKILHFHHKHGLCFKNLKAEHILVFLPSNKKQGGVRIEQKPVEFTRKTEPKEDIYMAGEILRSLTKC